VDVTYRFSGFRVDPVRRLLFGRDGNPIALKPRVFDTLLYLIEHRGDLLEKQAMLDAIWPHVVVEENNLTQATSTLRRVLGETREEHRFIVTEPGRGYRFVARVEVVPRDSVVPNTGGTSFKLGPYEITGKLGAGGMGEVYKALDSRLGRTVAIKVASEDFSARFEREARAVAALNHPNICQLYDVGPNYLVLEYIDGAPISPEGA
jgi:DNA-binding winged helix-turn-helix (wHTH) protein